jgi:hypothetical protein
MESLTKEMNRELLEKEFPDQKKALLMMMMTMIRKLNDFSFYFFFCTVLLFSSDEKMKQIKGIVFSKVLPG